MKALFRLFVFMLLVIGWALAAFSLHVVRKPGEIPIALLTKNQMHWRDTYFDTTKWTLEDAGKHPAFVERLLRTGKADVLKHLADPKNGDIAQQLSDALERAPREEHVSAQPPPRPFFRMPWDK